MPYTQKAGRDYLRVIFRMWRGPEASVVAVLLDVKANPGRVTCYEHVGQHSEGDYQVILAKTRPANVQERESLRQELQSIYGVPVLAWKRRRS